MVITGASSGIGRAAALQFARRGANVVLAARSGKHLKEVVRECEAHGVRALAVPTDVGKDSDVKRLKDRALRNFGRIDTWVSCAAVVAFGRFLDVPAKTFRGVVETNLFGTINGARAVLPVFRKQSGGVLIDVASVLGKEGIPYMSPYVTAKEGVIGFSACLREEFMEHQVHVCTVLPASVDTPIWQHGANYTRRGVQPIPPAYDPEDVAAAIVGCAERPRRIVYVGLAGRAATIAHKLAPGIYERLATPIVNRTLFQKGKAPATEGNVFKPSPLAAVCGGWERRGNTRLVVWPLLAGASLLGGYLLMKRHGHERQDARKAA